MMYATRARLVTAVSVALCGGAAFCASPGVAFADSYSGNFSDSGCWFNHLDSSWNYVGGDWKNWDAVASTINSYLTSGNTVTVNDTNPTTDNDGKRTDVYGATGETLSQKLQEAGGDTSITIGSGATLTLNNANGSIATITSGNDSSTTLNAASTDGTLSYGGWSIDASTGSIGSISLTNATATLSGTVSAGSVALSGSTIAASSSSTIKTYYLSVSSDEDIANISDNVKLTSEWGNMTIHSSSTLSDAAIQSLLAKIPSTTKVTLQNNSNSATATLQGAKAAATVADATALANTMVSAAQAIDTTEAATADAHVANLSKDLFSNTLPSAKDLEVACKLDAYFASKSAYASSLEDLNPTDKSTVESTVASALGSAETELKTMTASLTSFSSSSTTNAQDAYNKVIEAGRTLVAPVAGASRAAALIEKAAESNIIRRTEVLRDRPPKTVRPLDSKLDGKDALMNENIWADVRYNDVDIDTNAYCGKSNVALNSYALGYDRKVSDKDYVGVFFGTSAGTFDFYSHSTGTSDGSINLAHAFNGGIYGTHIMNNGHYVDYLVHYSKFDNDFKDKGIKWGTTSIGAMFLAGWKKQVPNGTINPYVSLTANKIANDDMRWCGNVLATKDQNNMGVKVGVDYSYNGGAFGGIAYSRGLSGHLASTVNDIALPSLKNDEQILYLKLGYRGKLNQHTNFDIMGEQYLLDYDGWSMNGKVEVGF